MLLRNIASAASLHKSILLQTPESVKVLFRNGISDDLQESIKTRVNGISFAHIQQTDRFVFGEFNAVFVRIAKQTTE